MKTYKLTDAAMRTRGGFQWALGEERRTDGRGNLCGPGWLHGYLASPLLAVLLNPIYGNYDLNTGRLFVCDARGKIKHDNGLKFGCTRMTLTVELPMPKATTAQRVKFAQLCAAWAKEAATWPRLDPESVAAKLAALAEEACK